MHYMHLICTQAQFDHFSGAGIFADCSAVHIGKSLSIRSALDDGNIHPNSQLILVFIDASDTDAYSDLHALIENYLGTQVVAVFDEGQEFSIEVQRLASLIDSVVSPEHEVAVLESVHR